MILNKFLKDSFVSKGCAIDAATEEIFYNNGFIIDGARIIIPKGVELVSVLVMNNRAGYQAIESIYLNDEKIMSLSNYNSSKNVGFAVLKVNEGDVIRGDYDSSNYIKVEQILR